MSGRCSNCNVIYFLPEGGDETRRNAYPGHAEGAVSAVFLTSYGAVRFVAEFFREPDAGIFGLSYTISMEQWLSPPMIVAGVVMLAWARKAASR